MSDAEGDDELEELRRKKMEELRRKAEGEPVADDSAAETPDEPIHVEGPDHYRELLDSHDLVLVDFYADWCGPCKMLEPIVQDLAGETDAAVLKVDIDANQGLAQEMGVRGVPTLYIYADGEAVDQVVGVKQKDQLRAMLEAAA